MKSILKYFPEKIKNVLREEIEKNNNIEEIRIRVQKPIILKFNSEEIIIKYYVSIEEILTIVIKIK